MDRSHRGSEMSHIQRQVLRLVVRGHTNTEIADALAISLPAAKWHVRELLTRFGVDSREELIDAWAAERSVGGRLRGIAGLFSGLAFPKAGAAAAMFISVAAVASIGAAIVWSTVADGGSAAQPETAAVEQASPTPAPPSAIDLLAGGAPGAIPGAIWTPDEALARAAAQVQATLVDSQGIGGRLVVPLLLGRDGLVEAGWHPGAADFQATDGDRYWLAEAQGDPRPRNLWHFRWVLEDVRTTQPELPIGRVELEVLLEDGAAGEPEALDTFIVDPADDRMRLGRGGGFFSRAHQAEIARTTHPVGDLMVVATANGDPDGATLSLYLTAAGTWCSRAGAAGGCPVDPAHPWQMVQVSTESEHRADGTTLETRLAIQTTPEVARLKVLLTDGREIAMATAAPPPPVPQGSRFAYVTFLGSALDLTIIAYDSRGTELGRQYGSEIYPPGAGTLPPPPPPKP